MSSPLLTTAAEARALGATGFVPTMGALHVGHLELMRAAARTGEPFLVSIFVNPKQFGPAEDFAAYPRDLDRDLEFCRAEGAAAVFAPSVEEMYPPGFATVVAVPALARALCGRQRPGHFDGVATVVARLFGLVRPRRAWFGWKDAQQLLLIRRLVEDLALGVEIVGIETVREPDGLACSSRNLYLSPAERQTAPELHRGLQRGLQAAEEGAPACEIVGRAARHMAAAGLAVEYVELRRLADLAEASPDRPLAFPPGDGWLLAAAVRLGRTRLIDNLRLGAPRDQQ